MPKIFAQHCIHKHTSKCKSVQLWLYPVDWLNYPVILRSQTVGYWNLKCLSVWVWQKSPLATQILLKHIKIKWFFHSNFYLKFKTQNPSYRLPLQVCIHFIHVSVSMTMNRTSMDVVAKTSMRQQQHWDLTDTYTYIQRKKAYEWYGLKLYIYWLWINNYNLFNCKEDF